MIVSPVCGVVLPVGFSANACLILVTVGKQKKKNKSGGMMDMFYMTGSGGFVLNHLCTCT